MLLTIANLGEWRAKESAWAYLPGKKGEVKIWQPSSSFWRAFTLKKSNLWLPWETMRTNVLKLEENGNEEGKISPGPGHAASCSYGLSHCRDSSKATHPLVNGARAAGIELDDLSFSFQLLRLQFWGSSLPKHLWQCFCITWHEGFLQFI